MCLWAPPDTSNECLTHRIGVFSTNRLDFQGGLAWSGMHLADFEPNVARLSEGTDRQVHDVPP